MRSLTMWTGVPASGLRRILWLLTFGLGCLVVSAPSLGSSPLSDSLIGFWTSIFAASLCVRSLARAFCGPGWHVALPRLICASYGLIAWSQLSVAVLKPALTRLDGEFSGLLGRGLAAYAAVALMQLLAIYRAAYDAWSHDR